MQKKSSGTPRTKKSTEPSLQQLNGPKQPIDILSHLKIDIKHKNETQKKLTQAIKVNDVIICTGPAGTGKTYIAVAEALKLLKGNLGYKKIVIIKSVTPLKGEEIGFLKGSLEEKMEPFIYSFISNFEKLIGKENTVKIKELNYIETLPISYLRGISIDDSIILIDEMQNISHDNMKTILTRLGNNSKMVFLGDLEQIDLKNKKESSVAKLIKNIKNKPTSGVEIVEFDNNDIVRHKLTGYFIDLFNDNNQEKLVVNETKTIKQKPSNWLIRLFNKIF